MDAVNTAQMIGFVLAVSTPGLTVLIGIVRNNGRLSDLRSEMNGRFERVNQRFDHSDALFAEKLRRMEEVFDARLTRIENGLRLR